MQTEKYKYKFSRDKDVDFVRTLKSRVNDYFKNNKISRYANANMIIKTILMLSLYIAPLVVMLSGIASSVWIIFALWAMMGFGKCGIGMCVMHDANHGAYSRNRTINSILSYSMNFIGANAVLWRIQHNVLHHTYTNIEGYDEDIDQKYIFRLSPHQDRLWIHRYQHIYVWLFYSLSTLVWMTSKNFAQLVRYRNSGLIKKDKFRREMTEMILWKVFYFSYILVLPMIILPISPWLVLAAFISMHLITGTVLSTIFQTAHIMPANHFPAPNEGQMIDKNWTVFQMETTTNYSPKSKIFSWLIGGLNYQVEHHLFSNVCHVHYRNIAKIASETAREFNIAYNTQKSFFEAVWNHLIMLKRLGRA